MSRRASRAPIHHLATHCRPARLRAPTGRHGPRSSCPAPLAAVLAGIALVGCNASPSATGGATPSVAASSPGSGGQPRDACTLVSTADLSALGLTAAGKPSSVTAGNYTTYGCTWGHPPADELHLQFEPL